MAKKNVLIMFGGMSAEHEVSIITGLQVVESIDRKKYDSYIVYVSKQGMFSHIPNLQTRKDFDLSKAKDCHMELEKGGPALKVHGTLGKTIKIDAAYLAFHGGSGENGFVQGFLETLKVPYTSPTTEGSVITMNKILTKQVLDHHDIPNVQWIQIFEDDFSDDQDTPVKKVEKELGYPVIVKPAHLGSSIGISTAEDGVQLKKRLMEAFAMDNEVLVERLLGKFEEYNCSVMRVDGKIELSEIERPIREGEVLSFEDKYKKGSQKTGQKGGKGGMASLIRELPAKIDDSMKKTIQDNARQAYQACRCSGLVRIDFMLEDSGDLFLTEINAIPGSMSYYLWEASGITFRDQITRSIEQAISDAEKKASKKLEYESDIVERFVGAE